LGVCVSGLDAAKVINQKTAIFRRINQHNPFANHDALEFRDGQIVLLTHLTEGQRATVLQLPAAAVETKAPQETAFVTKQLPAKAL
jgi:hypothetical protein